MFIFNRMRTVDNRAEVMLKTMEFEKDWRLETATEMELYVYSYVNPDSHNVKRVLLNHVYKLRREAMEISEQYYKLKRVMDTIHQ